MAITNDHSACSTSSHSSRGNRRRTRRRPSAARLGVRTSGPRPPVERIRRSRESGHGQFRVDRQTARDHGPLPRGRAARPRPRRLASAWRFACNNGDLPENYAGTQKEGLWRAFKSRAPMPLGERQFRNILAHKPTARLRTFCFAGGRHSVCGMREDLSRRES